VWKLEVVHKGSEKALRPKRWRTAAKVRSDSVRSMFGGFKTTP